MKAIAPAGNIEKKIYSIRGLRIMLDEYLALLYRVPCWWVRLGEGFIAAQLVSLKYLFSEWRFSNPTWGNAQINVINLSGDRFDAIFF